MGAFGSTGILQTNRHTDVLSTFAAIASLLFQTLRGARAADLLISFLASREGLLAGGGA